MKFKAPDKPKEVWSSEMIEEKIKLVEIDISELDRALNKTQSELAKIFQKRFALQKRISDKFRYKGQLIEQLKTAFESANNEWKEV